MRRATTLLAVLVIGVLTLSSAGCGDKTKVVTETNANGQTTTRTVPDVRFAKTKFVLHAGLAFGAFHRYILKPYQAGAFRKGAPKRTRSLLKAGAAGLFAVHELKQARRAALSDDRLRPLADRIDQAVAKVGGLASSLRGGSLNPGDLLGASGVIDVLGRASAGAGAPVKDRSAPIPGG